jgi:hypothetical protein
MQTLICSSGSGLSCIAYYRVSTDRQGQSGLCPDAQHTAVATFVAGRAALTVHLTRPRGQAR